jgi:protein-tyrosine phosphatase
MIDIHTHIIPQIDDGSRSLEESLEIARKELSGGTQIMIATPHVEERLDIEKSPQIVERVADLNRSFEQEGVALKVFPGAELYPSLSILRGLDNNLPITLAGSGKYVLIDLPHSALPHDFDTILFEIQSRGVTPILAHPERCPVFQPNPEGVLPYVERGICFQLNMGSFTGRHGAQATACVKKLFGMRIAHFLASDAHRPRNQSLGELVQNLSAEDATYARLLTVESGNAVIKGDRLPNLPTVEMNVKKDSLLSRLFGRRHPQYGAS